MKDSIMLFSRPIEVVEDWPIYGVFYNKNELPKRILRDFNWRYFAYLLGAEKWLKEGGKISDDKTIWEDTKGNKYAWDSIFVNRYCIMAKQKSDIRLSFYEGKVPLPTDHIFVDDGEYIVNDEYFKRVSRLLDANIIVSFDKPLRRNGNTYYGIAAYCEDRWDKKTQRKFLQYIDYVFAKLRWLEEGNSIELYDWIASDGTRHNMRSAFVRGYTKRLAKRNKVKLKIRVLCKPISINPVHLDDEMIKDKIVIYNAER